MTYRIPCNEPDFMQSVPRGNWTLEDDPLFPTCYRWRNNDTGDTVLVPAIWYTAPARNRAKYLRYAAEQAERNAIRLESEDKPWSPREAADRRRSAIRLRFYAALYDNAPDAVTGHVTDVVEAITSLFTGFARGAFEVDA